MRIKSSVTFEQVGKRLELAAKELTTSPPTFDRDGYPTEDTLWTIARWNFRDPMGWLEYIKRAWIQDYGRIWEEHKKINLATGGWSGNEDIVSAMRENSILWGSLWQSSHSGGLVVLRMPAKPNLSIPDKQDDEDELVVTSLKMYILIKESVPLGFAFAAAAHASIAAYLKFKEDPATIRWLSTSFRKVVCKVSDEEFEKAKQVRDHVVITESRLDRQEVALAFKPRSAWPKSFTLFSALPGRTYCQQHS